MPRPKHTRKDANHTAIVNELRRLGYVVLDVADLSPTTNSNPLDIFVLGYNHHTEQYEWLQCEIKTDRKASFTQAEEQYLLSLYIADRWARSAYPVLCITCAEDVLKWFGAI